jgi:hypothetical protein
VKCVYTCEVVQLNWWLEGFQQHVEEVVMTEWFVRI